MSHASQVFERTAEVLEHSAALADAHADWEEQAGHPDAARDERLQAVWARDAAQRARERAVSRAAFDRRS